MPRLAEYRSWEELWASAEPVSEVRLRFETPTTFRSHGLYHPLPLPSSIVRSWNERWQRYAPRDLASQVDLDASERRIVVVHLDGRTVTWRRRERDVVGFVGALVLRNAERDAARDDVGRQLAALSAIAPFAGTGSSTAAGFGVTTLS